MKIIEYWNNLYNRYSFHFFAWNVWILLALILIFCCICLLLDKLDSGTGIALLETALFTSAVFAFPIALVFWLVIYLLLLKKEKISEEFRIKSKFIQSNLFYKLFIILSFLLSVITFSTLLYIIICFSNDYIEYAFVVVIPIAIFGLIINTVFLKKK